MGHEPWLAESCLDSRELLWERQFGQLSIGHLVLSKVSN